MSIDPNKAAVSDMILERIVVVENCWHWTGSVRSRAGYGALYVRGRSVPAHRAAYEAYDGKRMLTKAKKG